MDIFQSFTPDQKAIIISLPYRVGYWISQSDKTGGDSADEQEIQVLEDLLHGFAGQVFGSELLQHIMAGTLDAQGQWPQWADDSGDALFSDCARAVDILSEYSDAKEVNAYKTRLMEIGEAVAHAFCEYDDAAAFSYRFPFYVQYALLRLKGLSGAAPSRSFDEFTQVSLSERAALQDLAKSLGRSYA